MPVKKPTAASAATKKEDHKHADLEKELVALKKELAAVKKEAASLKGQCHSCCGDIAALKAELADLKSAPAPSSRDSRVDDLLSKIAASTHYKSLRQELGLR